ncbi:MAG: dihydroneopterin aldolase [Epsilonproteobacteria bacterium]|nr:dihydroneopterin aldolase [Campylobacterota bacterium]
MKIYIEDLCFKCIIGILDHERKTKQKVVINATLKYHFDGDFINYADVVDLIKKTMRKKKFLLIEDALLTLEKKIYKNFPTIKKVTIKITKPSILPDCKVSVQQTTKLIS